jgi:hypothetical protein
MVLAAAYFGVLAAFPFVPASFGDGVMPPVGVVTTASVCWLFLLAYYLRQRLYSVAIIHTAPLIILLVTLLLVRDVLYPRGVALALGATISGAAVSLPLHLAKAVSYALQAQASARTRLFVNLVGGMILTTVVVGLLPSIAMRAIFVAGIVFGVVLGFWLGLYQATATAPALAQARVLGFSVRALAVGGFLAGLLGPLVQWIINNYGFGYIPLPMRYTPLYGVPMALMVGACLRLNRR